MFRLIAPEPSQQICETLVLSSSKPFIPSFCIIWKLIWLPFTMKLGIQWQPNGPHDIFSFTNPITWKLPHGKFEGHFPILIQSLEDYPHHNWKQPSNLWWGESSHDFKNDHELLTWTLQSLIKISKMWKGRTYTWDHNFRRGHHISNTNRNTQGWRVQIVVTSTNVMKSTVPLLVSKVMLEKSLCYNKTNWSLVSGTNSATVICLYHLFTCEDVAGHLPQMHSP